MDKSLDSLLYAWRKWKVDPGYVISIFISTQIILLLFALDETDMSDAQRDPKDVAIQDGQVKKKN